MTANNLFSQINTIILDLQAATLQTYAQLLVKLVRLLNHEDLANINEDLETNLDLEKFLTESANTGSSFVGTKTLLWPEDTKAELGMKLLFIKFLAEDPNQTQGLIQTYYYSDNKVINSIHTMIRQLFIPFIRDYQSYVQSRGDITPKLILPKSRKIFIVHGHDSAAREAVARFLEKGDFEAVILHEQANQGRTIIEKIEANADVGFAVVLLTPDDEGRRIGTDKLEPRARQNVLLELGYFIARLGRDSVCTLRKGNVEIPSDLLGVVWTEMDENDGWKTKLAKELKAADYDVDFKKMLGITDG